MAFFSQVPLRGAYKRDVEDVKETAIKMLTREYSNARKQFRLINGYRRVDPRRGAEYILDIGIVRSAAERRGAGNEQETTMRCCINVPINSTVEVPVSGQPRDAEKVSTTGDGRLGECVNTEFV